MNMKSIVSNPRPLSAKSVSKRTGRRHIKRQCRFNATFEHSAPPALFSTLSILSTLSLPQSRLSIPSTRSHVALPPFYPFPSVLRFLLVRLRWRFRKLAFSRSRVETQSSLGVPEKRWTRNGDVAMLANLSNEHIVPPEYLPFRIPEAAKQ